MTHRIPTLCLLCTTLFGLQTLLVAEEKAAPPTPETAEEQPARSASDKESGRDIVEIDATGMRPAFTRETVLRLNDIVRKSLVAIQTYDQTLRDRQLIVASGIADGAGPEAKAKAQSAVEEVAVLAKQASLARGEMDKAVAELEASDEVYNKTILAGMVTFVTKVDAELATHSRDFAKVLQEGGLPAPAKTGRLWENMEAIESIRKTED